MGRLTNVAVFVPSSSVSSLQDELADKSVDAAVAKVLEAYKGYDSDGNVPTHEYNVDLAGAVNKAAEVAAESQGNDLLVIVTDGVTANRADVKRQLDALAADDNGVVLVYVSNQADADVATWLEELDNDGSDSETDRVDVLQVNELPGTEVAGWFK